MRIGICSVGTELLAGDHADTNAVWLAQQLNERGARVAATLQVGDEIGEIADAVGWLAGRSDAVIVGGGLGPTPDDRTRAALAEVAGVDLERRDDLADEIAARFERLGRSMPSSNLRQADVPAGAVAYTPIGTAPGFRVEVARDDGGSCWVHALPGVPHELKQMAVRDVFPHLSTVGALRPNVTRIVHVTGMGEANVAEAVGEPDWEGVEVAFLAGARSVRVKLTATGADVDEARRRVDGAVDRVCDLLGDAVAGVDDLGIERALAGLLREMGLTVGTAESCTAGAIAMRLASVSGATEYLRGGIVSYATEVKRDVLGVAAATLDEHGPVDAETAGEMARRAREVLGADIGVSAVCAAGPTPQGGEEVGTTIVAVALPDGTVRPYRTHIVGDRQHVQARAAATALEALRRALLRLRSG